MYHKMAAEQRNFGIDLLRLVAALYVIIMHTVLRGGLYSAAAPYSYQSFSCQLLLSFSYCAVNIFGVISGYIGWSDSEKGFRFVNYLMLWLEVVFYGIVITLCYMWLLPGTVTTSDLLSMLFPITNDLYWYFSAYSLLVFFIPLLNSAVQHCSRQTLLVFFCFILFVFSPLETLTGYFFTSGGYSFLWLMILYLVGAILKKLQIGANFRPILLLCGILLVNICVFCLYGFLPKLRGYNIPIDVAVLEKFTLPFYLLSSILHVILFSKLKPGPVFQKLIAFAAPGAFAAYLVNVQKFVWQYGITDRFRPWANSSAAGILIRVILFSLLFVVVTVIVDYFRRKLFQVLHIKAALNRFIHWIPKAFAR